MLQKFLSVFLLSYSLIISSFAASTREIGFDIGTLKTQSTTPANPSSGKNKIYVKDGNLKLLDSTGSEKSIGSAESDNFISDPGAELVNTSCVTYADAAAILPVDGVGGVPNVTATNSTSSPLSGLRSLVFNKAASNSQGQGFSCDFTIDNASKGKVLRTQFDYEIASGTYTSGDIKVWIYDITNSRLIEPSSYSIESSGLKETKFSEWQSSIDSTSYRLIYHITSTSANAYTLKFDSFKIGRGPKVYGSVVTDWVSYTPIFQGFGTPTSVEFFYRKNGGNVDIRGRLITGTTTATEARVSLPSGMVSAGASLIPQLTMVGKAGQGGAGATYFGESVLIEPSVSYVTFGRQDSASSELVKTNGSSLAGTPVAFSMFASVPIQGWSSSQQLSQDTDTRVISAQIMAPAVSTGCGTNIPAPFSIVNFDTHGAYNNSTYTYTVPSSGYYHINANEVFFSGTDYLNVWKNGVKFSTLVYGNSTYILSGFTGAYFNAGDQLTFRCTSNPNINYSVGNYQAKITITKTLGPSQIAASESVSASYWLSGNFTSSTTIPINFDSKEYDSHNSVTTSPTAWKFTAQTAGVYTVEFSGGTTGSVLIGLFKNGTGYKYTPNQLTSHSAIYRIKLLAGEYIDLRASSSTTALGGTLVSQGVCRVSIEKTGNY